MANQLCQFQLDVSNARRRLAEKFNERMEEIESNLLMCDLCNSRFDNSRIVGCCSGPCGSENMCEGCGVFEKGNSDWYCRDCSHDRKDADEWKYESDEE
jgi:hypothetical protein